MIINFKLLIMLLNCNNDADYDFNKKTAKYFCLSSQYFSTFHPAKRDSWLNDLVVNLFEISTCIFSFFFKKNFFLPKKND